MAAPNRPMYYLISPAGMGNYGDELIAITWLRYMADVAPDAEVIVDCLRPEEARRRMADLHPHVRFTDTLWQACIRIGSADVHEVASTIRGAVDDPGCAFDLAEGLDTLRRADIVHIVGGGYVNSIWPALIGLPAGAAAAVRHSGGRAVMTGQGLCPTAAGSVALIRELSGHFDVIDVRDDPSAELLGLEQVTQTGDDVYLGLGSHLHRTGESAPPVMVSVQSQLSDVEAEPLLLFLAEVLRFWRASDVGLLECMPEEDSEILDLAEKILPVCRRYEAQDVLANGLPVLPDQVWLSTRFHPHLVAAAGGAGGVALDIKSDYYGTKHASLIKAGSGWSLLSEPRIPAKPRSGGFSEERRAGLRAAKREVADRIYLLPGSRQHVIPVRVVCRHVASGCWPRARRSGPRPPVTGGDASPGARPHGGCPPGAR
jgi:hypothetical protein